MLDLNEVISAAGDVWANQYHTIGYAALQIYVWMISVIAFTLSVLTLLSSWSKLTLKKRITMIMIGITSVLAFASATLCDYTNLPLPGRTRAPNVSTCIEQAYDLDVESYDALEVADTPITYVLDEQTTADVTAENGTTYRISLDNGVIVVTDLDADTTMQPVCSTEELAATLVESNN